MELSGYKFLTNVILPAAGEEKSNNSHIGIIILIIAIVFIAISIALRIRDNKKRDRRGGVRPWKGTDRDRD